MYLIVFGMILVYVISLWKKQVALCEIESTNNANIIAVTLNPKECYETFIDKTISQKTKVWEKMPQA